MFEDIDVQIGDGTELDWRAEPDDTPDDDEAVEPTPDDVVGLLGFDPLESAA